MSVVPVASVLSISGTISNIGYSSDNYSYKNLKGGYKYIKTCDNKFNELDLACQETVYNELRGEFYSSTNKIFVKAKIEVENYDKQAMRAMFNQSWFNNGYQKNKDIRVDGTCAVVASTNIAYLESFRRYEQYNHYGASYGNIRVGVNPQTLFNEIFLESYNNGYTSLTEGTYDSDKDPNSLRIQRISYNRINNRERKLERVSSYDKTRKALDNLKMHPKLLYVPGHAVVYLGYVDVKVDWIEYKKVKSGFLWWSKTKEVTTPKVTWERYYVVATGWYNHKSISPKASSIGYYKKTREIQTVVDID